MTLDALVDWAMEWRMLFHPDKCKVMEISKKSCNRSQLTMEKTDSSNRHVLEYTEKKLQPAQLCPTSPSQQPTERALFTYRVTMPWNALPQEIVQSISVNQFKNRLDKYRRKEKPTMDEVLRLGRIDTRER
ncbi:hypothetical protein BpHYR1_033207 [Brachionus plicatilis]|uniref:RNA-directed DNA polymerase from mobile element jockey-like n=1 Tax=Brachionus plicatilis TaxID=10195 RepID=A0A3M7S7J2_BRAPC|nr:hypothetical protein BpHYR1_033207 [Brachionus plicatilis]